MNKEGKSESKLIVSIIEALLRFQYKDNLDYNKKAKALLSISDKLILVDERIGFDPS